MRFSSSCVARDAAPVTPSIKGSITRVSLSGEPLRLALVKRSFAAFSSAASNAPGVGGGGAAAAGGVAAAAGGEAAGPVCASADTPRKPTQEKHSDAPRRILAKFIVVTPDQNHNFHTSEISTWP